jgi:hypothetical protein
MASLQRQNVHNADSRVAASYTANSHVIVIVSFDQSAASLCAESSTSEAASACPGPRREL